MHFTSRNCVISEEADNHGFVVWVKETGVFPGLLDLAERALRRRYGDTVGTVSLYIEYWGENIGPLLGDLPVRGGYIYAACLNVGGVRQYLPPEDLADIHSVVHNIYCVCDFGLKVVEMNPTKITEADIDALTAATMPWCLNCPLAAALPEDVTGGRPRFGEGAVFTATLEDGSVFRIKIKPRNLKGARELHGRYLAGEMTGEEFMAAAPKIPVPAARGGGLTDDQKAVVGEAAKEDRLMQGLLELKINAADAEQKSRVGEFARWVVEDARAEAGDDAHHFDDKQVRTAVWRAAATYFKARFA